jgi:hypothetical protein
MKDSDSSILQAWNHYEVVEPLTMLSFCPAHIHLFDTFSKFDKTDVWGPFFGP